MTPTEQDKELRDGIISILRYSELDIVDDADAIMQLITADRKRVALEARIDELYHVKPIVHKMGAITYAPRMVTLESIALRIAELKAQQEEV